MTKLRIWTHIYTLWLDFKINGQIGFNCPLFPHMCHCETQFVENLSDPTPPHQQSSTISSPRLSEYVNSLWGKTSKGKKTFSFRHCSNHLHLFSDVKNNVLRVGPKKIWMMIMMVAMIIMDDGICMMIMTKISKKTCNYCEVWVTNSILGTTTW